MPRGADVKNTEQDHVRRMLAFKQRQPTVKFDLAPNEFGATIEGHGRLWAMSLSRLMDKLEVWEAEQVAAQ
jgi:hypothetical protein